MAEIALTRGQVATVDDGDFEFLTQWNWYAHPRPCTYYAERSVHTSGRKFKVRMHRLITGAPDGMFVDHIDGNGLNNVRSNLRIVTHQENMMNRARWRRGATSNYRGVYLDRRDGRWFSSITVNGRSTYLGRFPSQEAARDAYEAARAEMLAGKIYRMEGVRS